MRPRLYRIQGLLIHRVLEDDYCFGMLLKSRPCLDDAVARHTPYDVLAQAAIYSR